MKCLFFHITRFTGNAEVRGSNPGEAIFLVYIFYLPNAPKTRHTLPTTYITIVPRLRTLSGTFILTKIHIFFETHKTIVSLPYSIAHTT